MIEINLNKKAKKKFLPLQKGDVIKIDDIRSVRPGFGLPTKMFDSVVGSEVNCNVSYGDPVKLADIIMKSDID